MDQNDMQIQTFKATLEKDDGELGWTIVHVPFDPAAVWADRVRLRVKGTVNGFPFRSSLFPETGKQSSYYLMINREVQAGSKSHLGQLAEVTLQPDLDPRPAELPDELDTLLDEADGLRAWYAALTEYTRREIGKWVLDVKGEEARLRRARQMAERMLYTLEAEKELPSAIAKALKSRPKATTGWAKMTSSQRRMELFAIGYYRTPESQAKRIDKLCAEAEKRADG